MIASVGVRIVDGGLGASRTTTRPPAVVGCSSGGSAAHVQLVSSLEDCVAVFGHGKLTELVGMYLDLAGVPVLACKAESSTAGSCGAITQPAGPQAQLSITTATARDDYAIVLRVSRAGASLAALTAAVRVSLDGGAAFGPELAVPASGELALGDTGVVVDFADGTFVVDSEYSFATTAPIWDNTALSEALEALAGSSVDHEFVHVAEHCTRTHAQTVKTALEALGTSGVFRRALLSARDQNVPGGESASAWQTALLGASPGFALFDGGHYLDVTAGGAQMRSRTTRTLHRRPVAWAIGPRAALLRTTVNEAVAGLAEHPGAVHLGPLPGVEEDGLHHDLRLLPSLDAGGFMGLQTHIGRAGYFPTDRTMAQQPSDYATVMNARVVVEGATVAQGLLTEHVGRRFRLATGGVIDARDADALDAQLTSVFRQAMGPLITEGRVTVNRASVSGSLRGAMRVRPYGYATTIDFSIGMTTE